MTPEAKQILVQLRETFYAQFATAMKRDVSVTKDNSLIFSPSLAAIASWVDDHQRFNYLSVQAHTAPDALFPDRPLTLRVNINPPSGVVTNTKSVHKKTGLSLNASWSLNLTVLPEEIVEMAHWVASWIHSQDNDSIAIAAPYRLKVTPTENSDDYQVWTQTAWYSLHPEEQPAAPVDQPQAA
ncbi:hypothetical protein [Acaryochloris sp. CCMEE 5410]|uniref:hypothetical protein n=1 Tax=Acaryochloris sp. CCMEE 5410 TaxID=310037 RepID=UPI00024838FB|nr:hypothetical protein [Acaryochloris sp. CCMEE 5410]KAI9134540.1 hypothetical protein ON05_015525 [Acaryochloris sp. CCMEE 5410]